MGPLQNPTMKDTSSLRRLANRVHVAIHDIEHARKFAETYKALRSAPARPALGHADELDSALGMAAIVSYARPFIASRSGGVADKYLKPHELKLFDGHPAHQVEHDQTILLRDQVVAHSDWTHRYSLEGVPDSWSESVRYLVAFDTKLLLANFHSFIDLTRHVEMSLASLLLSLERKILDSGHASEPS